MPSYVVINERNVSAFIFPGGEVSNDVGDVAQNARTFAKLFAPVRTGRLKAKIFAGKPMPRPPYRTSANVSSNVGYSRYVHEGTRGPIFPNGKYLLLKPHPAGGYPRPLLKSSVNGQRSQPYLARGLSAAMASYR